MAYVKRRENEDIESLLKRFKKQVKSEGIMEELKRRSFYTAPSLKRKEKSKEAQRRQRILNRKYNSRNTNNED